MELAVSFPSAELGMDPVNIRDFIQGAEQIGYTQVHAGEHIIGADPTHRPGWDNPYTHDAFWHEPFTLMTFLAAHTQRMLLVPAVLILPMRQTVLAAKQAAEVDGFSGGRLRLGIGIGSNSFEYEVLGQDFHTRGQRVEEQIAFLRELWTKPVVTFEGKWDGVFEGGITPRPVQQPIPIWMGGGGVEAALKRIGRIADGWILTGRLEGGPGPAIERYKAYAKEAGRDSSTLTISCRGNAGSGTPDEWRKGYENWKSLGATVIVVGAGSGSADQLLRKLRQYKEAVS